MKVYSYHFGSLKIFILGTSTLYWHMLCPELGYPVPRLTAESPWKGHRNTELGESLI